jgi:hypothetical protein
MSNKEAALVIFNDGIEAKDSRDSIIVQMVQAGCSLNSSQIWYKGFADDAGLTVTRVGHKDEALVYIKESGVDLLDDEARADLKKALVAEFGVATSTANDYVKAYAVQEGIELPTSGFGANPEDQAKIYAWIVDNADCEKEAFKAFMTDEMNRGSGSIDETWRGIKLARHLQANKVKFSKESLAA